MSRDAVPSPKFRRGGGFFSATSSLSLPPPRRRLSLLATSLSPSPPLPPRHFPLAVAASPKSSTRAVPAPPCAVPHHPRPAGTTRRAHPRQRRSTHHSGISGEHRIDPIASKVSMFPALLQIIRSRFLLYCCVDELPRFRLVRRFFLFLLLQILHEFFLHWKKYAAMLCGWAPAHLGSD